MAVVLFFLPLLVTGLNKALVLERQHHLAEQAITKGADLVQKSFQRFGVPLGCALLGGGSWLAEEVAAGVTDGMERMGHQRACAKAVNQC